MRKETFYGAVALSALALGLLALTNQSLWIDEGAAALKAMQPSLGGWWQQLRTEGNSNLQMLSELFYLWGWGKIFGHSELALRASNIPFFCAGVLALAWGLGPSRRRQCAIVCLTFTSAFLCYYLSEARPYIVLFAFAALTAASLFRLTNDASDSLGASGWFCFLCLGLLGLCATSMIAVPWALGAVAAVIFWAGWRDFWRLLSRHKTCTALLACALITLASYYLWTLQIGARASGVGRTTFSGTAYIFYELMGLAGLGPGRLEIRASGVQEFAPYLPIVLLGLFAVSALLLSSLRAIGPQLNTRRIVFYLLAVAAPTALSLAAGAAGHVRLVGRHLTPLFPYLLALFALGLTGLWESARRWERFIGWATLVVFLFSALEIRIAPRHQRDDYRDASALARAAVTEGRRVCWLADRSTGEYYGVPFASPLIQTLPAALRQAQPPDLVILSKPDIYDSEGKARATLSQKHFRMSAQLPAFQIWTRAPADSPVAKSPDKPRG